MLRFIIVPHQQLSRSFNGIQLTRLQKFTQLTSQRWSRFRLSTKRRPLADPNYREPPPTTSTNISYADSIPVRSARSLWRAAGFTVAVGAGAYTLAALSEYGKSRAQSAQQAGWSYFTDFSLNDIFAPAQNANKRRSGRFDGLSNGEKAVLAIMGANVLVFLLWRIPQLQPQMFRYFTNSFASKSLCSPMLLSVFSHNNLLHLLVNMYVLHSFAAVSVDQFMSIDQFFALFVTSGVFSSFASLAHKCAIRSPIRALGASGAICAILAYTCMKIPDARLSIIFMPFFTFSAEQAIYGLIAFDAIGLLLRFRLFDHAAHLGGSLFGILYALYGEDWIRRRFNPQIEKLYDSLTKR